MKLIIFGLTLSSSWGNGHATLWRGLVRALARDGHSVVFFERDVDYYARHRDLQSTDDATLVLYETWEAVLPLARKHLAEADVALVTSYCPDARAAASLIFEERSASLAVFYDLDTPVTLARLDTGEEVSYVPEEGLADFDLVLSYAGGSALDQLRQRLGARRLAPLYGHADPHAHHPASEATAVRADLSYLGTYANDRQRALEELFLAPARRHPQMRFVIGGAGYPQEFPWVSNIWFVQHVPPPDHPVFFSSSRLTLNVTRADMVAMGYCPSGRLFEAAACGTPVISDAWPGIEAFYTPGEEIVIASSADDVSAALALSDSELAQIGRRARERTLDVHTSAHRARELVSMLEVLAAAPAPHARGLNHVGNHSSSG